MASSLLQCSSLLVSRKNAFFKASVSNLPPSFVRFGRMSQLNVRLVSAASSAEGSSTSDGNFNLYEVLGVSPVAGFEVVKQAYAIKRKDAEEKGDRVTAAQLQEAYDKLWMEQLENRKKGVISGSIKVSDDVRFADEQPNIPWLPRFTKPIARDTWINLAISVVFIFWSLIKRNAEYKPMEFLCFAFVYRIYEKLRQYEPAVKPKFTEDGEEEGQVVRMGKRFLRSLCLVVSCVALSSFGYTSILNVMESFNKYIPALVYYNQEFFVTASSALMLFFMATYFR